jgi:pyruvate/2-oxoglutarate dehydrogenase complex dihydrolipoamide dehydrogenase (E3) component
MNWCIRCASRTLRFVAAVGVENMEIIEDVAREGLIELESGKHMVADLILFSVGRVGATDTLQLEAAGLKADERGRLQVNDYYQTGGGAHLCRGRCDWIPGVSGDFQRAGPSGRLPHV